MQRVCQTNVSLVAATFWEDDDDELDVMEMLINDDYEQGCALRDFIASSEYGGTDDRVRVL